MCLNIYTDSLFRRVSFRKNASCFSKQRADILIPCGEVSDQQFLYSCQRCDGCSFHRSGMQFICRCMGKILHKCCLMVKKACLPDKWDDCLRIARIAAVGIRPGFRYPAWRFLLTEHKTTCRDAMSERKTVHRQSFLKRASSLSGAVCII